MIPSLTYPNEIGKLAISLNDTKLLLLGEIHGVEENVRIIESLIKKLTPSEDRPLVLAFEWLLDVDEVEKLNNYIHTETDTLPNASFFLDSDGRFTEAHRTLLNTLRLNPAHRHITLEIFDTAEKHNYERSMADHLMAICAKNARALVIAETGVMHARKTSNPKLAENMGKPMAAYILELGTIKTVSVFIRYLSGEVIIEGETYNIRDAASQIEGPGNAFDFEISVSRAHPSNHSLDA